MTEPWKTESTHLASDIPFSRADTLAQLARALPVDPPELLPVERLDWPARLVALDAEDQRQLDSLATADGGKEGEQPAATSETETGDSADS